MIHCMLNSSRRSGLYKREGTAGVKLTRSEGADAGGGWDGLRVAQDACFKDIHIMPKGIPVTTVAIENAENAALAAVRLLAMGNEKLWERVIKYEEELEDTVLKKAEKLEREGSDKYLNP